MPDWLSKERYDIIELYGGEVEKISAAQGGFIGALKVAEDYHNTKDYFYPDQFSNQTNVLAHEATTGPEIFIQLLKQNLKPDLFVAGVGTGGTITGISEVLKARKPSFQAIAIVPDASPVLSGGPKGPHPIQGIGAGFVPDVLNTKIYNEVIRVKSEDAFAYARRAAREEGLLVGISSGAALWAAVEVAKRPENAGKLIVVIIPSFGERYLSTALFADLVD